VGEVVAWVLEHGDEVKTPTTSTASTVRPRLIRGSLSHATHRRCRGTEFFPDAGGRMSAATPFFFGATVPTGRRRRTRRLDRRHDEVDSNRGYTVGASLWQCADEGENRRA